MADWTPLDLIVSEVPKYWVDASNSSKILSSAGAVYLVDAPSDSARAFQQPVVSLRPSIISNGLAGKSVLRAVSAKKSMVSALDLDPSAGVSGVFIFGVFKTSGGLGGYRTVFCIYAGNGARAALYALNTGDVEVGGRRLGNDTYQSVSAPASGWVIAGGIFDYAGATLNLDLNGTLTARSGGFQTAGVTESLVPYDIAILADSSEPSNYWYGDLAELIVITGGISVDSRQRIEGYLAWKWGLQANLPADHPYKSAAPLQSEGGTKFTLEGIARLNGSPVAADVSVYESVSGALRTKVKSSAVNGYYKIEDTSSAIMMTGEKYFLLCNYGEGVRPLAHGPVTPAMENVATDSYWDKVVLLMNMEGSDNSTTFTDSKNGHVFSVTGATKISYANKRFGVGALYNNGSISFASTPAHSDFNFLAGDFTIEDWVFPTNITADGEIIAHRTTVDLNTFWGLRVETDYDVKFFNKSSGAIITDVTSQTKVTNNAWNHVALVRKAGVVNIFVNGTGGVTGAANGTGAYVMPNYSLLVGCGDPSASPFKGYIDELRITKGVGRYTENFTPPTEPFPQIQG